MQKLSTRDGDLGSLILNTIAFGGAGFGLAIVLVFDFIGSGWNLWSIKRLEPFVGIAATVLAIVWRFDRYRRYHQAVKAGLTVDYESNKNESGTWPPPPRPRD